MTHSTGISKTLLMKDFFSEDTLENASFGLVIAFAYYLYERGPTAPVCMIFHWIQSVFDIPHPYPLEVVCSRPAEALFMIEWQEYLYQRIGLFGTFIPLYLISIPVMLAFAIPIHIVEKMREK